MPSGIKERKLYLKRIEPHMRKPVVQVLTGLRRSGKSSLMQSIIEKVIKEDVWPAAAEKVE